MRKQQSVISPGGSWLLYGLTAAWRCSSDCRSTLLASRQGTLLPMRPSIIVESCCCTELMAWYKTTSAFSHAQSCETTTYHQPHQILSSTPSEIVRRQELTNLCNTTRSFIKMRLTVTLLALFTSVLAVPAPIPGAHAIADTDNHKVSLPETGDANPLSIRQEMQCDWDGFCADAFQKCVQTCDSLADSDWRVQFVRLDALLANANNNAVSMSSPVRPVRAALSLSLAVLERNAPRTSSL